jgi:hypothetical protein
MKCEHGNEVRVVIETESPICWDDGIVLYDEQGEGRPQWNEPRYLRVTGCDICKTIRMD